jgi:hypothetical protein
VTICPEHGHYPPGGEPQHFQVGCENCKIEFDQRNTALSQQAQANASLVERAASSGIDIKATITQHRVEALIEMILPRHSRMRMEFEEVTNSAVIDDLEDTLTQIEKAQRVRDLAGAPTHPAGKRLHVVRGGLRP